MKYSDKLAKLRKILAVKLAPGNTVAPGGGGFGGGPTEIPTDVEPDSSRCYRNDPSLIQFRMCALCTKLVGLIPFGSQNFKYRTIKPFIEKSIQSFVSANPFCEMPNLGDDKTSAFVDEFYKEWLRALNENEEFIAYKEEHNKAFGSDDRFIDKTSNPFGLYTYDCSKAVDSGGSLTEQMMIIVRLKEIISKLPKPPSVFSDVKIVDKTKSDDIINRAIDAQVLKARTVPEYVRAKIQRVASAHAANWFDEICGALGFGSPTMARQLLSTVLEECVVEWANAQNSRRPCMILSSGGLIMSNSDEWLASTFMACAKQKIKQRQDACGN